MPSSPEGPYDNDVEERILNRLRRRVRRITSRSRTANERAMAEEAVNIGTVLTKALQIANIGDPPYELVRAMRAPVGKQQLVVTYIHGHKVKTVINPLGMWRPDREAAVWKCLVKLVQDHAA